MSSWIKASKVNQKTHRERHQPESRQKYGLLEKKKDYKVRARHHQERERVMKLLKKRAQNRNPDEFYFHMINSKVEDGRHTEIREEDEHTEDQIKLMQTRDLKYINMRATMERKKIERLQSQLHFLDQANQANNCHIHFNDDDQSLGNLAEKIDTHPDLIARKTNRMRMSDLKKIELPDLDEDTIKQMLSEKRKSYRELERRTNREKELSVVQRKLEIKSHLLGSKQEQPKKIKPATKDAAPIYKWKYERKK
ncbi:PREDICTED: probable U3 small nucleolar RNA-associated protein 11 [Diuraphis noxia]|uniref:probable U3 small nucleolar RNA-associated protein 11 n=1 Tax=Diuraphis noxia TaxID=143948 RepID=UPI000763873C|nr:PREDICTED: probable U3 small nucleolar RNA-associated protein 11 [Diuraphis noxia]